MDQAASLVQSGAAAVNTGCILSNTCTRVTHAVMRQILADTHLVHRACRVGGFHVAQELVAIGARWNVRSKEQLMAIDYATMGHFKDIIELHARCEKMRPNDGQTSAPDAYTSKRLSATSGSFYDVQDDEDEDDGAASPGAENEHESDDHGITKDASIHSTFAASIRQPQSPLTADGMTSGDDSPYHTDDDEDADDYLSRAKSTIPGAGFSSKPVPDADLSDKEFQNRAALVLNTVLAPCLSDEHVKYLAQSARLHAYSARRRGDIVTQGRRKSCMWIVYSGKVRAKCGEDKVDVVISQGECFGVDELLTGRRHRRTCRAQGDCQVLCISKKTMAAIISSVEMVENIAACRAASILQEKDEDDLKKELQITATLEQVSWSLCMHIPTEAAVFSLRAGKS
jgi:hypothetical protein